MVPPRRCYRGSSKLATELHLAGRIEDEGTSEIVEEYRVSEDGKALTGTVTVSRIRGGEPRGSFVLHRRFERLP